MFIIGIVGQKKTGKDEVCRIIQSQFPHGSVVRVAFADALKEEVAQAVGQTVQFVDAHKDNFRLILQGWGTEFRRAMCGENYWIEKCLRKINAVPDNTAGVVVTDVRFLNEGNCLRNLGAKLLHLARPGVHSDEHQSETELTRIKCDYVIFNDSSLNSLESKVHAMLCSYKLIF